MTSSTLPPSSLNSRMSRSTPSCTPSLPKSALSSHYALLYAAISIGDATALPDSIRHVIFEADWSYTKHDAIRACGIEGLLFVFPHARVTLTLTSLPSDSRNIAVAEQAECARDLQSKLDASAR